MLLSPMPIFFVPSFLSALQFPKMVGPLTDPSFKSGAILSSVSETCNALVGHAFIPLSVRLRGHAIRTCRASYGRVPLHNEKQQEHGNHDWRNDPFRGPTMPNRTLLREHDVVVLQ